jgi:hypothetical protein
MSKCQSNTDASCPIYDFTNVPAPIHTQTSSMLSLSAFCSIYATKSSIVHTLIPHCFPNAKHSSLLIIPPPSNSGFPSTYSPSVINSQMTPTGCFPANLHRSTAASVCPLLTLSPPSLACSGSTCPGLLKLLAFEFGSASIRQHKLRSCALMPVVTLSCCASTVTA